MGPKRVKVTEGAGPSSGQRKTMLPTTTNNPHGIVLKDTRQQQRYSKLLNRPIVNSRYPYYFSLELVGLDDNVKMLFENIGWTNFMSPPRFTYEGLTLEFLSSLRFEEDTVNNLSENHRVSFRMFRQSFKFTLTEFSELLGFQNSGYIHDSKNPSLKPEEFSASAFWNRLTGQSDFIARRAKASSIQNPVFRYIQKILACTIFGRGEVGGVRVAELFLLWAMVYSKKVNTPYYMLTYLEHVVKQPTGPIVVGGVITFIAEHLGFTDKLRELTPKDGSDDLRLDTCVLMQMFKAVKDGHYKNYYLLIGGQKSLRLPDKQRTDTREEQNWLYLPTQMQEDPMPEPQDMPEPPPEHTADYYEEQQAPEEEEDTDNFPPAMAGLHDWCRRIEGEQTRQGAELQLIREEMQADRLRQQQEYANLNDMMQQMMRHFGLHPPPGEH